MPSRRAHTKSHHGCARCKRRRIKCDETGPPCSNCVARNAACQYSNDGLFRLSEWNTTANQSCVPASGEETTTSIGHHRYQRNEQDDATAVSESPDPPVLTPRMRELQLMHRWCTKTCYSFSPELGDVFRDYVVQKAICYSFLMDALLSLTSLHIASELVLSSRDEPMSHLTRDHVDNALRYQSNDIPALSEALREVTPDNSDALFACLVIMMACAVVTSSFHYGELESHVADDGSTVDVTPLFHFIQGIHSVIGKARSYLGKGPFASSILTYPEDSWRPARRNKNEAIRRLRALYLELDMDMQGVYAKAIDLLESCFEKDEMMAIPWVAVVGEEFLSQVQKGEPVTLLIYIHWGVLLYRLKDIWWARISGRRIVMDLSRLIVGHEEWAEALQWALREVQENN